ncbi:MAG: glycoside hydrolase family 57 protein [bacterium]|nr:glycoside hydrolase family 57 protein [bacterium]
MHPLRIAFLWHFHQPDYRSQHGFTLPWVRLHAAKDYAWLPDLFAEFPAIRQTINIVPSLIDQLAAYSHGTTDALQREAKRIEQGLLPEHPNTYAHALTVLHAERMIAHKRHDALHVQAVSGEWHAWTIQEWIDLTVWYHLAWCSPHLRRQDAVVMGLLSKGQNFTTTDVQSLMHVLTDACDDVVPTLRRLHKLGQIDVSVTPYHHPILPLLCNTESTRDALPDSALPIPAFVFPQDASSQVKSAKTAAQHAFDDSVHGMWPAEGSISNEALKVFARHGIRWVASDEGILANSLGEEYSATSKYRAWAVGEGDETVSVVFRDRALSDAIGFTYSNWDANRAADDFIRQLEERRRLIVQNEGTDALLDSVVSIILDGENCWEFYENNGESFLRALCARLANTTLYSCIGMNEATRPTRSIRSIVAGSWIGASFDIWIGSPLKNLAWSLLREARSAVDCLPSFPSDVNVKRSNASILDDILSAESSDWFWWYDDRHQAPNKRDFDMLFRERLTTIFNACSVVPSIDLSISLYDHVDVMQGAQKGAVHVSYGSMAMHTGNQIVRSVAMESNDSWQRLTIRLERKPVNDEQVTLILRNESQAQRLVRVNSSGLTWSSEQADESARLTTELELEIYVQFRAVWTVEIEEVNDSGEHRTATIELRA